MVSYSRPSSEKSLTQKLTQKFAPFGAFARPLFTGNDRTGIDNKAVFRLKAKREA
jgi:hypothetical protein